MAERKDVRRFSLSALAAFIDQVSDPQAVATLQVSDGFSERVVYFAAGGVRLLSVGERGASDIPSYLLECGKIDVETLHEVLERVRTGEVGLRQVLEDFGVLSSEEFRELNRRFIRDEIFDLVFWDDTYYKVYPTSPPQTIFSKDRTALTGNLHFVELAEDVNRWISDWKRCRKVLLSDDSKLYLTSRGRKVLKTCAGAEGEILRSCGDGPSIRELRRQVDQELPELCALLVRFVEDGALQVMRGETAYRGKNIEASIEALEASLERVIDRELVQEKLANLYSKSKQSNKATEQLVELASECLARDDLDGAEKLWSKIVALKAPNSAALELFASAYTKRSRPREISRIALQYATALSAGGHVGAGEEVASLLRRINGAKMPALEFQANWLSSKGRLREASDTYSRVMRMYAESGDFESAVAVAERAVECDPTNTELSRSLTELRERQGEASGSGTAAPASPRKARTSSEGVGSKVLLALVAVAVIGGMHYGGVFKSIASAEKEKSGSKGSPTAAADVPGADDEFLPGAGFVPKHGRKGLDPGKAFALNEEDGSVSTPLGKFKLPGGNGAGGGAGAGGSDLRLPGGSGTAPTKGLDPSGGGAGGLPFDPFDGSAGAARSGAGGASGSRSTTTRSGEGFDFANGPSLPFVGRRPGSRRSTGAPSTRSTRTDTRSRPDTPPRQTRTKTPAASQRSPSMPDWAASITTNETGPRTRHTRIVNQHLTVTYRTGDDLVLRKTANGEEVLRLQGERGARWTVDQSALSICRWAPGKTVRFYNRFGTRFQETAWKVPANAEALVASETYIAVRAGETTGVFRRDGSRVESGRLPRWTEGVFVRDSIVLTPPDGQGFWVYHAVTLELQWTSVEAKQQ